MPVFKKGSSYSQFQDGGEDITETLTRLTQKRSRGKGRLGPAPTREAIGQSSATSFPSGAAAPGSSGWVSPLQEQAYDTANGFFNLVSSDGFMVFEMQQFTEYKDDDGAGALIKFKHIAP